MSKPNFTSPGLSLSEKQKLIKNAMKSVGVQEANWRPGGSLQATEFMSSGIFELDEILAESKGFARGSVIELCGESGSGKTYVACKTIASEQQDGRAAAFFGAENSFYPPRAAAIGVQVDNPELFDLFEDIGSAEKYGEMVKSLAKTGAFSIIVVDSITALVPDADYGKSLEDSAKVGAHAQFIGRFVRDLIPICRQSGTTVILINQFRYGAGRMPNTFMKKSSGGEGLGFYCHTRCWFEKVTGEGGKLLDKDKNIIGGKTRVKKIKDRYGPPDLVTEIPVYFTEADTDYIGTFVYRATRHRDLMERVTCNRKVYRYIDTDSGEVLIQTKDEVEFVKQLQQTPAPDKRTRGDNSATAFEYVCGRMKLNPTQVAEIETAVNSVDMQRSVGDDGDDFDNEADEI